VPVATRHINEYLFYEFGFDEADAGRVSENWPFELKPVGRFVLLSGEMTVFEFADEGETYFALDGPTALSFLRSSGMSPEDIRTQQVGATWIGQREPVDLGTARIGYEGVPTAGERRVAITQLVAEARFREPRTNRRGTLPPRHGRVLGVARASRDRRRPRL
jgi:hypothetical protein